MASQERHLNFANNKHAGLHPVGTEEITVMVSRSGCGYPVVYFIPHWAQLSPDVKRAQQKRK